MDNRRAAILVIEQRDITSFPDVPLRTPLLDDWTESAGGVECPGKAPRLDEVTSTKRSAILRPTRR